MPKQLECRVVITNHVHTFDLGMYEPIYGNFVPLGTHPLRDKTKIVGGLRDRIAQEGHRVTFSEITGER